LGQADPGPALSSGPGLAQKILFSFFWAEIGPTHFGPKSAQQFWAESGPVGWAGPAQPIEYYIIFCIIYIYIYIYIYEKIIKKFLQKL
jgi:hypothetical protein